MAKKVNSKPRRISSKPPRVRSIYFAGDLFTYKALLGNAVLADAIHRASKGSYRCVLPQNQEPRKFNGRSIRNRDLLALFTCDVGLFHLDGSELDSGTVVEFILAKMLDIPAVLLRSDFRRAGDDDKAPWNLMLSYYPRTKAIVVNSILDYQTRLYAPERTNRVNSAGEAGVEASLQALSALAKQIVKGLNDVNAERPVLSTKAKDLIYSQFATLCGGKLDQLISRSVVNEVLNKR